MGEREPASLHRADIRFTCCGTRGGHRVNCRQRLGGRLRNRTCIALAFVPLRLNVTKKKKNERRKHHPKWFSRSPKMALRCDDGWISRTTGKTWCLQCLALSHGLWGVGANSPINDFSFFFFFFPTGQRKNVKHWCSSPQPIILFPLTLINVSKSRG